MALKDKLMTLEDFKAVRDVDVASNTAQFTEIKADLDAKKYSVDGLSDGLTDDSKMAILDCLRSVFWSNGQSNDMLVDLYKNLFYIGDYKKVDGSLFVIGGKRSTSPYINYTVKIRLTLSKFVLLVHPGDAYYITAVLNDTTIKNLVDVGFAVHGIEGLNEIYNNEQYAMTPSLDRGWRDLETVLIVPESFDDSELTPGLITTSMRYKSNAEISSNFLSEYRIKKVKTNLLKHVTRSELVNSGVSNTYPYYGLNPGKRVTYLGFDFPIVVGRKYYVETVQHSLSDSFKMGIKMYNTHVAQAVSQQTNFSWADAKDDGWRNARSMFTGEAVNGKLPEGISITYANDDTTQAIASDIIDEINIYEVLEV